jgi:DNA-binding transcriptional MerR regulator
MSVAGVADDQPRSSWVNIGTVLHRLKPDFPEISISKIRFLESEGLVTPRRTPSGYRQYCSADVQRLRYVLTAQRDHHLPLKVIKDQLEALDRGEPVVPARLPAPVQPGPLDGRRTGEARLSRRDLLADTGLDATQLAELEHYGLLVALPGDCFDATALLLARTVAELLEAGLEPRHLRLLRSSAEREASLVAQLVSAQARQLDPDARERADAQAAQLAAATTRLHAQLVRSELRRELSS